MRVARQNAIVCLEKSQSIGLCCKPLNAQDNIELVQGNGVAVDGEDLLANFQLHGTPHAALGNSFAIGNRHLQTMARMQIKAFASRSLSADEIVRRAAFEQHVERCATQSYR